jgi:hypothetical protein
MVDPWAFDFTDEQVRTFREQGFLSLKRITTDEELEWLRGVYDDLVKQWTGYSPAEIANFPRGQVPKFLVWIPSPETMAPELNNALYLRNGRSIAARLLGGDETKISGAWRMFFKPARHGCETPWHQDAAHRPSGYDSLNIWMPLDPATLESGCLHYIAGSHLRGIRPHRPNEDDPSGLSMKTDDVDPSQAIACPLPAGGATVHHCRTLHYSGTNQTDQARRAFVLVFKRANNGQRLSEK